MSHPLEYHNFVMAEVNKIRGSTILDIGVGFGIWGYLMHVLRRPSLLIGIDINRRYLLPSAKRDIYDCLVLASASSLPFRDNTFDYVLAIEVIEHLLKIDGEKMLEEVVRVGRDKIVLTTPNNYLEQHCVDATESEEHRSGWSTREFRRKGYKLRGIGLKGASRLRSRRSLALYGLLNYLSTVVTFFFPNLSEYILAVKELRGKSCAG